MARNEYGVSHQPISPLWASTTWNSWIRSRLVACVNSRRSASPRVPTSENARSRRSAAKSSQAAITSRLWAARSSGSRRRQAGSTLRNVYLTKWRSGMTGGPRIGEERLAVPRRPLGLIGSPPCGSRWFPRTRGHIQAGSTRHIEALATELDRAGHDVKVFAPFDTDRRRTALLHRGARPQVRDIPEWLVPLGSTIGWPLNGAVSNVAATPSAASEAAARAARGQFRRRSHPGTGRSRGRLGRADERRRATCRHVPLLLGVGASAQARRAARRAAQAQPPARADRGVRGRGVDRAALLRRPLPGDPERRRAAAGRRAGAARRAPRASRCGSRSSARPSSARACRCCCARSRRCAGRSRPS